MIQEAALTAEDLAMLQAVVDQKVPVAAISCNCIPGQCQCKTHATK
jgi:ribonuclease PH